MNGDLELITALLALWLAFMAGIYIGWRKRGS